MVVHVRTCRKFCGATGRLPLGFARNQTAECDEWNNAGQKDAIAKRKVACAW